MDHARILAEIAALPEDRPVTLPGQFYVDEGVFASECAGVLAEGWYCMGRADELAEPGDALAMRILDEPVVAVRGADGALRVMSNLCRHRSMPLLPEGKGRIKRFTCSYHAWSYGLDGGLLRAPHMKNAGFNASACALPRFACEVWNGFLYVSLAAAPRPLAPRLTGLDALIAPYQPDRYRVVHTQDESWACNWKCLVENFMEGYHLSVVHPQTLRAFTPTELARKSASGDLFTSYIAHYPDGTPSRGVGADGLSAEQRQQSVLFSVFPAQVVSISANMLVSLALLARAPDRVDVRWTMSVHPNDDDPDTIAHRIGLWNEVNREDRDKLEWLQQGLASRHAGAGPLAGADMEGTIRDFHLFLARAAGANHA